MGAREGGEVMEEKDTHEVYCPKCGYLLAVLGREGYALTHPSQHSIGYVEPKKEEATHAPEEGKP